MEKTRCLEVMRALFGCALALLVAVALTSCGGELQAQGQSEQQGREGASTSASIEECVAAAQAYDRGQSMSYVGDLETYPDKATGERVAMSDEELRHRALVFDEGYVRADEYVLVSIPTNDASLGSVALWVDGQARVFASGYLD